MGFLFEPVAKLFGFLLPWSFVTGSFFFCLMLSAGEPVQRPLVVSLGCDCSTAGILRNCGIRKAAYPFDWLRSIDLSGLIKVLDDDFAFFFEDRFAQPGHGGILYNIYHHLEFSH